MRRDLREGGQEKTPNFWFGRGRKRDREISATDGFSAQKGNGWKEDGKESLNVS